MRRRPTAWFFRRDRKEHPDSERASILAMGPDRGAGRVWTPQPVLIIPPTSHLVFQKRAPGFLRHSEGGPRRQPDRSQGPQATFRPIFSPGGRDHPFSRCRARRRANRDLQITRSRAACRVRLSRPAQRCAPALSGPRGFYRPLAPARSAARCRRTREPALGGRCCARIQVGDVVSVDFVR